MKKICNGINVFLIILFTSIISHHSFAQTEDELMQEAVTLYENGKAKKALKLCDQVIKDSPNYLYAYSNKSAILVSLKKYDEALITLDNGLVANPTAAFLYYERAMLFQSYTMTDRALRDYNLGIKFAENDDTLRNSIMISKATAMSDLRNFQGAYDILMKCYAFDSTNLATLNNLATVCDEIGKSDLTLVYLMKVIEADSTFLAGYVNIGFMYQTNGEFEKSIPYFDKALEIDPNEPLSYSNRGYSKLKIGDLEGALKDVNRSLELYPGNAYAYRNRALIYIAMDKMGKACEDLENALRWNFTQMYGNEVEQLQRKHCK